MKTVHQLPLLRKVLDPWRAARRRIALVPTMGNLHDGHLTLVDRAREMADRVVVSIFVNPLQFGPNEDYQTYPRTLEVDGLKLGEQGADLLFAPRPEDIYPRPAETLTRIHVPGLEDILCGATRPGHFSGVATVVNILFNMVQPDIALFGEKDYQQLLVIHRMASDLHLPVAVGGVPTVREADGLAMSSRNNYLSAAERRIAPELYRRLQEVRERILAGQRDYGALEAQAIERLRGSGFRPDYLRILRAADLQEPRAGDCQLVILAAAWLGKARLIDNTLINFKC